ncbi:hypothetical protein D3C80_1509740 [compost metagenome]
MLTYTELKVLVLGKLTISGTSLLDWKFSLQLHQTHIMPGASVFFIITITMVRLGSIMRLSELTCILKNPVIFLKAHNYIPVKI